MTLTPEAPCPFCGGNVIFLGGEVVPVLKYRIVHYMATCANLDCRAQGPHMQDKLEAIEAWNRLVRKVTQ